MIVHNFDPVLVDFGFLQIRWYSLAYICGIVAGWFCAIKIIKLTAKNEYSFNQIKAAQFDNLIVYIVVGIILGGRLGYVFFYNSSYFIQNFSEIFKLWEGGMSFHGGLLGVILATFIFSKREDINLFKCTDIISCVAPIGIFFGRIANFINGELYGKVSSVPWSVVFPAGGNFSRHPSQIYEAILEGVVLFLIINFFAYKKAQINKHGYTSALFLIYYSLFRIFSELFREADNQIGYFFNHFSMGTLLSLITLFLGFVIMLKITKNE